jgi:tRNA(Ile)-lysidine synthase
MIKELKLHLSELIGDYTQTKFLLAVSGGVDSVVLTELFAALGLDFALAHCNFQLRDVDSDADERFVSILANRHGKEFWVQRFATKDFAKEKGVSTQMAAREMRYTWFQYLASSKGYQYIVTAHHKNDLAETLLLNLSKGTGHAGLVGIKPVSSNLLRPLLKFDKEEFLEYASQNNLAWREDASNSVDKYQRNHLRLNVMPLLQKINPKVEDAFLRTSEKMVAANSFINSQIENIKGQICIHKNNILEIDYRIFDFGNDAAFILSEILRDYGFDFQMCTHISAHHNPESGLQFFSESHHLVCDRGKFVIVPIVNLTQDVLLLDSLPEKFTFGTYSFESKIITFDAQCTFDKNTLVFPEKLLSAKIQFKYPATGDSMAPYGMKGKRKKIADLLNDAKVPLNIKKYTPIFQLGDEIIWLVGHRASEFCKVENGEKAVVLTIL